MVVAKTLIDAVTGSLIPAAPTDGAWPGTVLETGRSGMDKRGHAFAS